MTEEQKKLDEWKAAVETVADCVQAIGETLGVENVLNALSFNAVSLANTIGGSDKDKLHDHVEEFIQSLRFHETNMTTYIKFDISRFRDVQRNKI